MKLGISLLGLLTLAVWTGVGCGTYDDDDDDFDRDGYSAREEKPWTKTHRAPLEGREGYPATGPVREEKPWTRMHRSQEDDRDAFGAREEFNQFLSAWPEKAQEAARPVIAKYGPPTEACESHLIWKNNGPWAVTKLSKEEVRHDWPKPHSDVLFQAVHYKVPADKFDDLAAFDGSVVAERTKGTLGARCDKEEMNFLAVNLAHDIVEGKKSVEEARRFYETTAAAFMKGEKHEYTQGLQFRPSGEKAGDPDKPAEMKSEKSE